MPYSIKCTSYLEGESLWEMWNFTIRAGSSDLVSVTKEVHCQKNEFLIIFVLFCEKTSKKN